MKLFTNDSFVSVHKALDAAELRQQVITNNIANATTPGYKKSVVRFEEHLSAAMNNKGIAGYRTDARHIPIGRGGLEDVQSQVKKFKPTFINNNHNNVDIEEEMTNLAKNQIWYDALSQNMTGKFQKIKTVIGGGR